MSSSPPVRRSKRLQKQIPEEPIAPLEKISSIFKEPDSSLTTKKKKDVKNTKTFNKKDDAEIEVEQPKENTYSGNTKFKKQQQQQKRVPLSKTPETDVTSTKQQHHHHQTKLTTQITPNTTHTTTIKRRALKQVEIDQINVPTTPTTTLTTKPIQKEKVVLKRTPSMKETFPGRLEWKQKHYDKPVTSTPVTTSTTTTQAKATKTTTTTNGTEQTEDAQTCFGFDDPDEDLEYSTLISPIPREKVRVEKGPNLILFKRVPDPLPPPPPPVSEPTQLPPLSPEAKFNHLYHQLHLDEDENDDGEKLHVNRGGIKATYSNPHVRHLQFTHEVKRRDRGTTKSKSSKRTKKTKDTDVDKGSPKKGTKANEVDPELEKWIEQKNKEFEDIEKVPLTLEKSL